MTIRVLIALLVGALLLTFSTTGVLGEGSADDVDDIDLAKMTLPLDAYGPAYASFAPGIDSFGFEPLDDRDDRELNAYFATYYSLDVGNLTAGIIGSGVGLFGGPADAESFLADTIAGFQDELEPGGEVQTFEVPAIDGAIGVSGNLVVPDLPLTLQVVVVMFPLDGLVGQVAFVRFGEVTEESDAAAAAVALRDRMKGVLSGKITDFPAPLPPDVNCNGSLDAIDASLILQLGAGLVDSLPCDALGDANQDGRVDAIDASLILQFSAELIDNLPV